MKIFLTFGSMVAFVLSLYFGVVNDSYNSLWFLIIAAWWSIEASLIKKEDK